MDRSSPLDVTIIDKDESSEQAYHVVDGFVIEDSKSPFPVSVLKVTYSPVCVACIVCTQNGNNLVVSHDLDWYLTGPG